MIIYFIILLIIVLLIYVNKSDKGNVKLKDISIVLSIVVLIFFAGFRSKYVGTDTYNYILMFEELRYDRQLLIKSNSSIEKGYLILQNIAYHISTNYWSLLTLIAAVCVLCNFYVIKKLSKNFQISVFIYVTLAFFVVFFNAARQGLAVSIAALSLIYVIKKDFIRFVVCLFIASLFHRTALIFFPFYFILRTTFTFKKAFLFSIVGFIVFALFSRIISLFDSEIEQRYSAYEDRGAMGGGLLAVFFIFITFFFIKIRSKISKDNLKEYDIYLNLCLFTSIIYLVVIATGSDVNFIRITNYFGIGYILIWPIIFKDISLFNRSHGKIIFIIIHLLFYMVYLLKMANLVPYQLNPNLF